MAAVVGSASGSPIASATATAAAAAAGAPMTWDTLRSIIRQPHPFFQSLRTLPGSGVIWRYIQSSHQNDPARTFLELLLFLFVVYTWLKGRTRGDKNGKNFVKLSEKEIDELVNEWHPEPFLTDDPELLGLPSPPVIIGPPSLHPKIAQSIPEGNPSIQRLGSSASGGSGGSSSTAENAVKIQEKQVLNLASTNFSGLAMNERVKEKAIECLRGYGVGSCGPSGFYGFFDVHIELENQLAAFLGAEAAIIYPQGFTTVCSAIPSFAKRGDIIVADKGVNFAIQKGLQISRSHIRWYDHNDMDSLEEVLEAIDRENKRTKAPLTRRFIVTDALFEADGQIADLPRIMELKKKFKYRLMLDETWSIGALGKTGRGLSELYDIPADEIDIIMGSMAVGLCAGGGFCAGSSVAIAHQRINSAAYVFSASLPPLLAVAASEGLNYLAGLNSPNGQLPLATLPENIKTFRTILDKLDNIIYIPSSSISPLIHIYIRKIDGLTFYDQERLLQEIADECINNGVYINRTKKVWKQESVADLPSLRICISSGLTKKEVEKAANVIKSALTSKLGKGRR